MDVYKHAFELLGYSAATIFATNVVGFVITAATRSHKITDLFGAVAFLLSAIVTCILTEAFDDEHPFYTDYRFYASIFVMAWAIRISSYLFSRVLHLGEDKRLRFLFPKEGEGWDLATFGRLGAFWFLQSMWAFMSLIPMSLSLGNTSYISGWMYIVVAVGALIAVYGLALETTADYQKDQYKKKQEREKEAEESGGNGGGGGGGGASSSKRRKSKDKSGGSGHRSSYGTAGSSSGGSGKRRRRARGSHGSDEEPTAWCDVGVWKNCRFPNYGGEMSAWFGLWVSLLPDLCAMSWWFLFSAVSPLFVAFLIICVSGVPSLESGQDDRYGDDPRWEAYKQRCTKFIPWKCF